MGTSQGEYWSWQNVNHKEPFIFLENKLKQEEPWYAMPVANLVTLSLILLIYRTSRIIFLYINKYKYKYKYINIYK